MAKCELYQDVKDEWRWRRVTKSGDIEAHSTQGFETEEDARDDEEEEEEDEDERDEEQEEDEYEEEDK